MIIIREGLFLGKFASHLVCTAVARATSRWVMKVVDEVRSTIFNWNSDFIFATSGSRAIAKADHLINFTIFHCRMGINQPAWPFCTTSECWHTLCWHSCSCMSHKTIPSLRKFVVTKQISRLCWLGFCVSTGFTQIWVMMARIGYKERW